jgi:hypothetical protein
MLVVPADRDRPLLPAADVDFDADRGAILVIPTAVERTRSMSREALDTIRAISTGMANP